MPSRFAQELRGHGDEELRNELESAHEELFTLRFQAATRQLADVSKIRKTRRQVARLRTLLHERDFGLSDATQSVASKAAAEDEE